MKNYLKIISVICMLLILVMSFASCTKNKEIVDEGNVDEEISSKYDAIADSALSDKPLGSDAYVLGFGFSQVDFTFTSADDTIAFSLDRNSFVKLAQGGTFYNYITPGSEPVSYEAGYKTARGISLASPAGEILLKYGIDDNNAIYSKPGDTLYYNPVSGAFSGKLTALFASKDSVSYSPLTSLDVQKFLSVRPSDSAYMNPADIMAQFGDYTSLVSIDITADQSGAVSELCFYRFDK